MKRQSSFVQAIAVVAALVLFPLGAVAQPAGVAALATAEAAAFIGNWTLTLESPQGAFAQTLVIKDADGHVQAEISNELQPDAVAITDISKAGDDLVLRFTGDFQGQPFNATITMTPDGDKKAKVSFDVMDGQFVMEGDGVKN
jgi:hypothetical protein